ncbi:ubiquitin-like modifier 1 [Vararia minispora EC-137]|uniref:Ubiquitin-like modifier 1 n=1 Tax=Vararia minispora EC-137 TaxID=1314806 RepID=A0ACB8QIV1_9AGAM|nr:ubiquitin-like modifier 1 [Vararia minispora EC-137]
MAATLNLKVEFGGGLELLFDNVRSHRIALPAHVPSSRVPDSGSRTPRPANITFLIHWLKDNLLKERAELFVENETVRPGILVLVNDTDWELEGEGDYELKSGDEIVFISTLHGG